jgi:hypothetical protein
MIKELDQVVLTTDLSGYGLQAGDIGTVVLVHQEGAGYEVEFVSLDGETRGVVSLFAAQVRPIAPREIARVRTINSHPQAAGLLATARAFAADALPLKTEFTRRGLPDGFLDDLNSDIEEFEQAINQKIQKRESQVSATAAIDSALESGINVVRELDVIMRNQFASDPASLAAWLSASHTERSPRRAALNPLPTPPAPPPAPK